MRPVLVLLALLLAAPAFASAAKKPAGAPAVVEAPIPPLSVEPDDPPRPWRLIRTLQRLQAQMAQGSAAALKAQPDLVAELTRAFAQTDPALWKDRRNAAAALALLLSGGDPAPMRKRYDEGAFGDHAALVAPGLAFAEGRIGAARELLDQMDEPRLGATIAAQAAMALGTLAAPDDPVRAHRLFDRARLLSPGTLIEETALRRQIRLAEDRMEATRFLTLAHQYARRYGASVYAGAFHERLPAALARFALQGKDDDLAPFERLFAVLPETERAPSTLAIARAALARGRFALSLAAARRTLELTATLDPQARVAALYAVVAMAPREGPSVIPRLENWPAQPTRQERELLAAATAVARQIYAWPPRRPAGDFETPAPTEAMARALRLLAEGETLLETK